MLHQLASARKRAGLSQQALADLIRMDRVTIARIEGWQMQPSLETIGKIIDALKAEKVTLSADAFLKERA